MLRQRTSQVQASRSRLWSDARRRPRSKCSAHTSTCSTGVVSSGRTATTSPPPSGSVASSNDHVENEVARNSRSWLPRRLPCSAKSRLPWSAKSRLRLPGASARLGQQAAWAALAGHTGLIFDTGQQGLHHHPRLAGREGRGRREAHDGRRGHRGRHLGAARHAARRLCHRGRQRGRRLAVWHSGGSRTSWLSLRPAGSPEAPLSAGSCLRLLGA